jgi:hypothetical protein
MANENIKCTPEQFAEIHAKAMEAAARATQAYLDKYGDMECCGFAWVSVYNIKLSTKLGKAMKQRGFDKAYGGGIQLWNPSQNHTQSLSAKEAGAVAYCNVLREYGFTVYAGSRMD